MKILPTIPSCDLCNNNNITEVWDTAALGRWANLCANCHPSPEFGNTFGYLRLEQTWRELNPELWELMQVIREETDDPFARAYVSEGALAKAACLEDGLRVQCLYAASNLEGTEWEKRLFDLAERMKDDGN